MHRPPRPPAASVLTLGVTAMWFILTASAQAQAVAPAITPARISIETPVASGTTVQLPSLVVRNRGTESLVTAMGVAIDGEDMRDWIRFAPATFELAAGASRVVEATLEVPDGVALGDRTVRLRASVRQDAEATGVAIGLTAAVASLLVFEVGLPPEDSEPTSSAARSAVGAIPLPLWFVLPAAIAAGAASWTLMTFLGRYEFTIHRKPPSDPPTD